MNQNTLSTLDVIRTFYINEELLPKVFSKKSSPEIFEKELILLCEKAQSLTKKKLLSYHMDNWGMRYYHYLNAQWELREVSLDECGVWPKMSSLPSKMTYGSALDTAKEVRELLDNRKNLTWKNHRVLYIEKLLPFAEILTKHLPLILLEGGTLRTIEISELKDKQYFRSFPYDIDDGNNRAVALSLLGHTRVQAFVGTPLYKNPLLQSWY